MKKTAVKQTVKTVRNVKAKKVNMGNSLRGLRESKNLTPAEFCKKTKISVSHLSNMESGRRDIPLKLAGIFGKVLGVNEKDFIKLSLEQAIQRARLSYSIEVSKR